MHYIYTTVCEIKAVVKFEHGLVLFIDRDVSAYPRIPVSDD